MPIITISQAIKTVGWDEAVQQAPAEIVVYAKEQCNKAIPTVMARNDQDQWCVLCWYSDNSGVYTAKIEMTHASSSSTGVPPS